MYQDGNEKSYWDGRAAKEVSTGKRSEMVKPTNMVSAWKRSEEVKLTKDVSTGNKNPDQCIKMEMKSPTEAVEPAKEVSTD